jgi:hypothetical protein
VIRFVTRGTSNTVINVFDPSWSLVESIDWKYDPNLGTGVPSPLEVGSQSKTDLSSSRKQQGEWSDPVPATGETRITGVETITTKAGKFETYRIEASSKFSSPNADIENKSTYWFSPKIDHWVRLQFEQRSGGRLVLKTSQELLEYKIR